MENSEEKAFNKKLGEGGGNELVPHITILPGVFLPFMGNFFCLYLFL